MGARSRPARPFRPPRSRPSGTSAASADVEGACGCSRCFDGARPAPAVPHDRLVLGLHPPERLAVLDVATATMTQRRLPGGTLCRGPLMTSDARPLDLATTTSVSALRAGRRLLGAAPAARREPRGGGARDRRRRPHPVPREPPPAGRLSERRGPGRHRLRAPGPEPGLGIRAPAASGPRAASGSSARPSAAARGATATAGGCASAPAAVPAPPRRAERRLAAAASRRTARGWRWRSPARAPGSRS